MTAHRVHRRALLLIAALVTVGAGVIHATAVPEHLRESVVLGLILLATAAAQLVLGVAVLGRPTRRIVAIAAATDLLSVAVATFAQTTGVPLGLALWHPEPLSISDLVCPALELSAGLLLVLLVAGPARARRPRAWLTALATLPAIPLVVVATVVGALAAPDDTWLDTGQSISASPGKSSTLAYCSPGGSPLAVDVTEPTAGAARPAPTVLYVHGGGWTLGDRQTQGPASVFKLAGHDGALSPSFGMTWSAEVSS